MRVARVIMDSGVYRSDLVAREAVFEKRGCKDAKGTAHREDDGAAAARRPLTILQAI
jgi:hypothetical protein